jgi:hypothetical protein
VHILPFVGDNTIAVRKIKKGCHAEALEACALGIANYALALMHGVKAFARMLRVPQHDTLPNTCGRKFIFRTPVVTTPTKAKQRRMAKTKNYKTKPRFITRRGFVFMDIPILHLTLSFFEAE